LPRILIVEDNELSRDMLSRRLEKRGYEIAIARDGEEGVAKARAEGPDLILMDLALPVLDGWEATKQIKAERGTADIPVIGLSAHAMSEDGAGPAPGATIRHQTGSPCLGKIEALLRVGRSRRETPFDGTETSVEARPGAPAAVRAFVEEPAGGRADASACFDLKLAVGEACTSIIEHAARRRHHRPRVRSDGDTCGHDRRPGRASPRIRRPTDLRAGRPARRGLGWHLIRQSVDEIDYGPDPAGGNRLTLVKRSHRR
jgi:CheY-like chemotaxis protein